MCSTVSGKSYLYVPVHFTRGKPSHRENRRRLDNSGWNSKPSLSLSHYCLCLVSPCDCDQSGSALGIALQRCRAALGRGLCLSMATSALPWAQPRVLQGAVPASLLTLPAALHRGIAAPLLLGCGCTVLLPLPLTADPMATRTSFSVCFKNYVALGIWHLQDCK